jgi:hypothetical protein
MNRRAKGAINESNEHFNAYALSRGMTVCDSIIVAAILSLL